MRTALLIGGLALSATVARAQCTNFQFTITSGTFPLEIDWEFIDGMGNVWTWGGAPNTQTVCLPADCYTMYLYDSFGDGWNGATWTIQQLPAMTTVASGTLTNGVFGTMQVNISGGCGGGPCDPYTLSVTSGGFPTEISWNLIGGSGIISTGYAPTSVSLCIDTGCYMMDMYDTFGDGWNGATWSLIDGLGATVASGTLASGSQGQVYFALGVPAAGCAPPAAVTASDCNVAVNICTNYSWAIDPNGIGSLNEVPPLGSLGNPDFMAGDFINSPWGTDNYGCLRANELNSTWMIVNISGSGSLEFTFGGFGTQSGFYDWIMYPYGPGTCAAVMANTVAPVRCNWNGSTTGGTGLASVTPPGGNALNYEPPLMVLAGQQYLICFSNWSSVTTTVPLEFGGTATVSCDPFILPAELLGVQAVVSPAGIDLRWSTGTESNVSHFVVERSLDNWHWTPLGQVAAVGNSQSQRDYAWLDATPAPGTDYYRIAVVDNDGSLERSETVSARWQPSGAFIHPNPSHGMFWVESPDPNVRVLDATGRAVPFTRVASTERSQCLRVPGTGLFTVRTTTTSERVLVE